MAALVGRVMSVFLRQSTVHPLHFRQQALQNDALRTRRRQNFAGTELQSSAVTPPKDITTRVKLIVRTTSNKKLKVQCSELELQELIKDGSALSAIDATVTVAKTQQVLRCQAHHQQKNHSIYMSLT